MALLEMVLTKLKTVQVQDIGKLYKLLTFFTYKVS